MKINHNTGLPNAADLPEYFSKGELAGELYPYFTYDTALPQRWVDDLIRRNIDPRAVCVWIYQQHNMLGEPAALTQEFFDSYRRLYGVYPVCPVAAVEALES